MSPHGAFSVVRFAYSRWDASGLAEGQAYTSSIGLSREGVPQLPSIVQAVEPSSALSSVSAAGISRPLHMRTAETADFCDLQELSTHGGYVERQLARRDDVSQGGLRAA